LPQIDLEVAQAATFSQQIPFLYGLLVINTTFTMLVQAPHAPIWLGVIWPCVCNAICIARLVHWHRQGDVQMDRATARLQMRRLNVLAVVLTVVFMGWGTLFFAFYGDPLSKAQAAFYVSFTGIGCGACLMQAPRVNATVSGLSAFAFFAMLSASGETVLILIALNYVLVLIAMLFIMRRHGADFARLVASTADIVEKTRELQKLSDDNLRLANLDSMTGLPNRRMFFTSLEASVSQDDGPAHKVAVGILDLDGFKGVNDAYGHGAGDQLLIAAARRLELDGERDFLVHRLGGDEFALISRHPMEADELLAHGQRICDGLAVPYRIGNLVANVTATIGFATWPENAGNIRELFDRADYALYHAKRSGHRGAPILFASEHGTRIRSESVLMQALRTADLEHELYPVFQPIVDARTREVRAFEALARWTHPSLGSVSPAVFVPLAERMGVVGLITGVMLPKALAELRCWPGHVRLSFNLSVEDVGSSEAIAAVCRAVRESGVDPRRIDFEITETALVQNWETTLDSLHRLIELGARIALDDFGTGYSSLAQLHRLPLHKIKIDRAFVTGIEMNDMSRRVVQSVVKLASDIGIVSVVEGVETEAECSVIRDIGTDWVQGFLFHRPLSAADAAALVAAPAARAAS
jgi:diguanylate cyclase (GGDEF)-like protein